MTDARRALFALGAVVCLLVVASALPAADPRLDPPGTDGGDVAVGQWDAAEDGTEDPADATTEPRADEESNDETSDDETSDERSLAVRGPPVPGTELTVDTGSEDPWNTETIVVDGEVVGETSRFGEAEVTVPYAEEMTVSIEGEDVTRTVDIETNATIYERTTPTPNGTVSIAASIGREPVVNATVSVDGESVTSTDDDGDATVPLPPSAGPVEVGIEREVVTAERTVDVPEPTVAFATPLLFPGFPAPVVVSAGDAPVENATVEVGGEPAGTTGGDGRATVWLPIEDAATVTATVGVESATTTVGNLYFRLAAVVVVIPGLLIGGILTYLKLAALRERRRAEGLLAVFVGLAAVFEGLSGRISGLMPSVEGWRGSVPSIPRPSLSGLGGGWRLPAIGSIGLQSLGAIAATVPSLGSFRGALRGSAGGGTARWRSSRLGGWLTDDETADDDEGSESTRGEEPVPDRSPREEIRVAWHGFVDRLDVRRRETTTPGTVARRAIRRGFPADSVRRLLAIVRDVEYGGRDPSPDRVAGARAAAADLIAFEADEDEPGREAGDARGVSEE